MITRILSVASAMIFLFSQMSTPVFAQKKELTFEEIFESRKFSVKNVPGFNPMQNEKYYSAIRTTSSGLKKKHYISIFDITTRQAVKDLVDVTEVNEKAGNGFEMEDYTFNHDESKMLLYFNGISIYRHSTKYITFFYDIASKEMKQVDSEPILHATFSPDGSKIAYVKNNNLYVYTISSGDITAITTDGKWNHIINGNCDWVYEEEFSFTQAYQWSPDSRHIAFYRFDESRVKEFTMAYYEDIYPEQYTFKYPKAGEENSIVSIHIYNVASKQSYAVDLGSETDIYIPRIYWANADDLLILRLNRHQNHLEYLFHNLSNQTTIVELTDKSDEYVDILDPIVFFNEGQDMLYLSEKSGFIHLHQFNRKNKKDKDLTPYEFDVNNILGYNVQNKSVYFIASPENPLNNGIYSVSVLNGKVKTIAEEEGWYSVQSFPSTSIFMVSHSSVSQAPHVFLMDASGKVLQNLEDNHEQQQLRSEYNFGTVKFMTLKAADGSTPLNGYLIYPHDFQPNKKYPVLMYQYSGPGSQEVKNAYNLGHGLWHHYLTTKGYIIACFDGRGTGNRGEKFKKCTYLQLGKYESDDQIAIGRQLGDLDYIDASRIGIWGWSFGGFISSICILKGHDVFKTAISVAPVTHWALYDNIYTERFMRTPQENPDGYNENSPLMMANLLKGNFLLIHGTADDNVHFQNAVMLTKALIQNGKQFESTYYPDGNHGIGGGMIRAQLYRKMTNYLLQNL